MADEGRGLGREDGSSGRLWRFSGRELDEARRELKAGGHVVEIEAKPLDLLLQLLIHAGEVVTKEELMEAVWPGVFVVEGSLSTAVSKLRKALGDEAQSLIVTMPRAGYRLVGQVEVSRSRRAARADLKLEVGGAIPGREQWRLTELLDSTDNSEVWLAEHGKTHERRVFKFAADSARLASLRREVALARLLRDALGERSDFVRVLEWNFDIAPFFLESEYGGLDLGRWAVEQGGLASVPLDLRLALMTNIARAVAAAHGVGVLHKDLKPANVLVSHREGGWRIKVADFGSGRLLEPERLAALGITDPGFARVAALEGGSLGTPLYDAPEVLTGSAPTVASDVYALGVMLYQMIVGDFRRPLSAGWEADVADPLLRADVAAAAAGDPERRLNSAADLVERLESLETRRAEEGRLAELEVRAREAEARLQRERMRRPWVAGVILALAVGAITSGALYLRARRERDLAESIGQFLSADLLSRSNPFKDGKPDESLVGAVEAASPDIDRRFKGEPQVAARLHLTIAHALDKRSAWPGARREYDRAKALFLQAGADQDAVVADLQRSAMEARSYEKGSLDKAKQILAVQEKALAGRSGVRADMPVWLATARGMVALIGDDPKTAAAQFQAALNASQGLADFDDRQRLTLKQRLAFASIRLGQGDKAEAMFRDLIAANTALDGPEAPEVLQVRLNLAQALMIQGKHAQAVTEATSVYPLFVQKFGADHEMTLQLLTTRAQSEGALERWSDAIADDLAVHEIAVKKQGPQSFFAVATLTDAATAQCRGGQAGEGLKNAGQARQTALSGFGAEAALTHAVTFTLADCMIAAGRVDEAARLLPGIDPQRVAGLAADPNWGANLALARGQVAYARHDLAEARRQLAAAATLTEPFQKRALERLRQQVG